MITAERWKHMPPEERSALPPHIRWRYVLAARRAQAGYEGVAEFDARAILGDLLAIVSDGFGMSQDCLMRMFTQECAEILAAVVQIARLDFRLPKPVIAHALGVAMETLQGLPLSNETIMEVREWVFQEWERTPEAAVPPPARPKRKQRSENRRAKSHSSLVREIVKLVSRRVGVHPETIMGRQRTKEVAAARAVAMAAMKATRPYLSTTQIGELFKRDHSTVIHNLRKVQRDPTLQALQREVLRQLILGEKS